MLTVSEAAALLREIGILTADGKLKNDMIRKYKIFQPQRQKMHRMQRHPWARYCPENEAPSFARRAKARHQIFSFQK